MLSDLLFRLRALFQRRAIDAELDAELRFHLDRETEKLERSGLSRAEAQRQAALSLGGLAPVAEDCREARGTAFLEHAFQDFRYALRGMRRRPAFALAAVLTLGLGAGAISTVFTLADTLFLRELPVSRPDRLAIVQPTRRHGRALGWISYPDYVHFRDRARTLQSLAAHYSTAPLFVSAGPRSQEINGAAVSANFFPLLGLQPALGRFFRDDEDAVPGRDPAAVLSYGLWRNWFGSSPGVLGATLKINGTVFSIIGVAPAGFRGLTVQPSAIYIPTMMLRTAQRWCADALAANCPLLDMIGRLRDGVTVEQARAEISTLLPPSWAAAKERENTGITVFPARGVHHPDFVRSSEARFIQLLAYVAAVLLLVCCMNLAGLLIARNSARTREFAIRASLGAGRRRLMQQLIAESLLLAAGGGLLGMCFSLAMTGALNSMFYSFDGQGRPLYYNFSPEPRVILAVLAVSLAAGFLAGIVPSLKSIRADAAPNLKRHSQAGRAGSPSGRWLAGAQVAVAVALAVVAGLLASGARSLSAGVNFDASHAAVMRVRPRLLQYPPEKAQQFVRAALDQLQSSPAVESASMVGTGVPIVGGDAQVSLPAAGSQAFECGYIEIGPRYFETLRTPVLRGREFNRGDAAHSQPVAIVTESLARRLNAALGTTVIINQQPRQVVGIVADVPLQTRGEPAIPYAFAPFWQNPAEVDAHIVVRVKGDPAAILPELVRTVNRIDPEVPISETVTLSRQIAGSLGSLPLIASFVSYAAVLAVLLSAIGLYGALAFSVSRRTKEIGIRMAIGARSGAVLLMVVREGMAVVVAGGAAGIGLALAATRVVRHLLYGSGAADPQIYAAALVAIACAGLFACWVPARRASSVEPLAALREE